MSRSKHAVQLCALLVESIYGELTSRIFSILLRRGRLHTYQLGAHTSLTRRQIFHGLAVLIQQNLIYYYVDITDGRTYYEANNDAAYALVRIGKVVNLVEERHGPIARDIVQILSLLGHSRVSDLEAMYKNVENAQGRNSVNGFVLENDVGGAYNDNATVSVGHLHAVVAQLLQSGFIEPVKNTMFRSPTDTHDDIETMILRERFGGQIKGTKQKEELKVMVHQRVASSRDEMRRWSPSGQHIVENGHGLNGQGKKRTFSSTETGANDAPLSHKDDVWLDPQLVVRVNHEKFGVALRNRCLVELARSRIGEITSQVYAGFLRLLERKIPRCRNSIASDRADIAAEIPTVTTAELGLALGKSVKIARGIGDLSHHRSVGEKKGRSDESNSIDEESSDKNRSREEGVSKEREPSTVFGNDSIRNGDAQLDRATRPPKRAKVTFEEQISDQKHIAVAGDERDIYLAHLKMHLQLLAQDSCKFICKYGNGGSSEWTVDFEPLMDQLRESELDAVILENFGAGGHRLVRMLRKLGKLEEKALLNMALMKQKDIRTKMAELQMAGMVDIQEVPRDANRSINRTIFLWYFDPERVTSILLDGVYKAMSRSLQRLETEKRRASGILTMIERSDVRQVKEEEVLDVAQMRMLDQIRSKEEKLLCQIGRLDELVGVFRDF